MTADEFVECMHAITPTREMLIARGVNLIVDELFSGYSVVLRPKPLILSYKVSALFTELFSKYDVSKLVISYFTFFDQPVFDDHRWFFGFDEGERLCVNPGTQEVCAEGAASPCVFDCV